MTNETQIKDEVISYQPIKKMAHFGIFFSDFDANKKIMDLVKNIEKYEKVRGVKTQYFYYPCDLRLDYGEMFSIKGPPFDLINIISGNGKNIKPIISGIKIESEDSIVKGKIKYCNEKDRLYPSYLHVYFNFNSNSPADKEEYLGLAKILKNI